MKSQQSQFFSNVKKGLYLSFTVLIVSVSAWSDNDAIKPDVSSIYTENVFFDLPPQPLAEALIALGIQARISLVVQGAVESVNESTPVYGRRSIGSALHVLLEKTAYEYEMFDEYKLVVIRKTIGDQGSTRNNTYQANNSETLEEDVFVVSARRRNEILHDVPISLTIFSGRNLDQRGAQDLVQLGASLTNASLQVIKGTNTTLAAYIRGIGQDDPLAGYDSGVGIYIDDVYLNRPQGAVLDIYDVERIEILRGPQGTLYGRNTLGGAIKYVTKKLADQPSLSLKTYIGSYYQRDIIVSASTPISDSRLKVGASFGSFNHDGYGKNLVTGADNYNKDIFVGRLSIEYISTNETFIRFNGDFSVDKSNPRSGHRFIQAEGEAAVSSIYDARSGSSSTSHPVNHKDDTADGYSALIAWDYNLPTEISLLTAYREDASYLSYDLDSLEESSFDVFVKYINRQFSEEFRFNFKFDRLRGVFGAFYLKANAISAYDAELNRGGFGSFTLAKVNVESRAVFTSLDYDVYSFFNISLGVRYTHEKRTATILRENYFLSDVDDFVSPYFGGQFIRIPPEFHDPSNGGSVPRFTGLRRDEKFTPHLNVSWQPNETVHLYSSYSVGFRSGGFDPRGNYTSESVQGGFSPEDLDAYEIGLKNSFFDGVVTSSFAVFYSDYRNIQVNAPSSLKAGFVSDQAIELTNNAKANITGLELELSADLTEALKIELSVGAISAKYNEYFDGEGVNIAKSRAFVNTPDLSLLLSVSGYRPLRGGEISWLASANYRSAVYLEANAISEFKQPSYSLLNASVDWESPNGNWQIGLYGLNLTNETVKVAGNYYSNYEIGTAFYSDPRTIKASLKWSL